MKDRAMRLRRRSAALRVEPATQSQAKPAAAIARGHRTYLDIGEVWNGARRTERPFGHRQWLEVRRG